MAITPGSWRAVSWHIAAATTIVSDSGTKRTVVAECGGNGRPSTDSLDDARVMAAAPAMLAALRALHRICRDCDLERDTERPTEEQYCSAMDAAEAALFKATGEAPC